jgi:hypothetical protein
MKAAVLAIGMIGVSGVVSGLAQGGEIRLVPGGDEVRSVENAGAVWYGSTPVLVGSTTRPAPTIFRSGQAPQILTQTGLSFGAVAIGGDATGDVVGIAYSGLSQSSVWTSSAGITQLTPNGNGITTPITKVSSDGAISGTTNAGSGPRAYLWTGSNGLQVLATQPTELFAFGTGVSGNGTVVGFGTDFTVNQDRAWRWTSGGGYVPLAGLSGSGGVKATGVSDDGSTVIGMQSQTGVTTPIVWRTGQVTASSLNVLTAGTDVAVSDVSGDGSLIVGRSAGEGVVWASDGSVSSALTFFSANGVDMSGWSAVYSIQDVSRDGLAFVGTGAWTNSAGGIETRSFIAVIPAPSVVGGLAMAAAAFGRRRR